MLLKSDERFHALDACRAGAMLLGIFLHSAASFFATPVGWAIRDRSTNLVADLSVGSIHVFRMPVFFLLSGFFARLLYQRLGARTFVYHRVRRILVPFVVALPLLSPTMNALWRWGGARTSPEARLGSVAPMFDIGLDMGRTIVTPPGHLWFLYYLSVLLAILVMTVFVLERLPLEQLASSVDRLVGMAVRGRYLAFIVAVPTAPTLLSMKQPGAADTPYGFLPQPWVLAYYGILHGRGVAPPSTLRSPAGAGAAAQASARRRDRGVDAVRGMGRSRSVGRRRDRSPLREAGVALSRRGLRVDCGAALPGRFRSLSLPASRLGAMALRRVVLVLSGPSASGSNPANPRRRSQVACDHQVRARGRCHLRVVPDHISRLRPLYVHRHDLERKADAIGRSRSARARSRQPRRLEADRSRSSGDG